MIHYSPHFRDSQYTNPTVNKSFICLAQCVSDLSWKRSSSGNLLTWKRNGVSGIQLDKLNTTKAASGWIAGRNTWKVFRNRLMATKVKDY